MAAARCGTALGGGGWMVGDNPVNDSGGGRSAGLSTIWISDDRSWPPHIPGPYRTAPHARAAIDLSLLHSAHHARTTT
ncbi:HAD hydrolase-like protein [Streptomyces uncialis]|uniref:HAD hydrolase-like protein n=1 Tax=Streptomyces uncialis TaxID=1048205 RepID=UPI0036571627